MITSIWRCRRGRKRRRGYFTASCWASQSNPKAAHLAARGCWFQAGDIKVHLGVDPDFVPARKAHPAFLVENLDSLCAKLEKAGFLTVPDQPLDGYRRQSVSDPFGNRIELMEIVSD